MKIVLNVVGGLCILMGGVWFLQGINILPGSVYDRADAVGYLRSDCYNYRRALTLLRQPAQSQPA